jgi:hypothetical protein
MPVTTRSKQVLIDRLQPEYVYPVIKRRSNSRLPYGYAVSDEDFAVLTPNDEHQHLLQEIIKYLDDAAITYTAAAEFLQAEADFITLEGIRMIMKRRTHPIFMTVDK